MKTNEEMTEDFVRKFYDMLSHIEACLGASERIRLTNEVKALLKSKDGQCKQEMIELVKYLEQQMYDIEPKKKERIISRLLTQLKKDRDSRQ